MPAIPQYLEKVLSANESEGYGTLADHVSAIQPVQYSHQLPRGWKPRKGLGIRGELIAEWWIDLHLREKRYRETRNGLMSGRSC
jgi:hypothetical protein